MLAADKEHSAGRGAATQVIACCSVSGSAEWYGGEAAVPSWGVSKREAVG